MICITRNKLGIKMTATIYVLKASRCLLCVDETLNNSFRSESRKLYYSLRLLKW